MPRAFRVLRHGTVDSTNERALAEVAAGRARDGDVHVARGQTAGRGRRGASWASPEGEGLYLSAVLLPERPIPPAALTIAGGLAVFDALEALRSPGARELRLKWPNDVLLGEAKVAGILVETRGLDPARPHYVVGIGVNVLQRAFPPARVGQRSATSLCIAGIETGVEALLEPVMHALAARLEQAERGEPSLALDFLSAARLREGPVAVEGPAGVIRGRIAALDLHEGLTVVGDDGRAQRLPVEHVRAVAPI